MKREILNLEQGTPEWFAVRMGCVTASEFHTVMAAGKAGAPSKTRRAYMLKLIGERLTQEPQESYCNVHMERGKVMEAEARELYELVSGLTVEQVGFIKAGDDIGCSPDGMVGADGLQEIKTKLPHLQLEVLLRDEVPAEHMGQCQGALWVAEREWIDFVSYWPKLPIFIKRVYRDTDYIAKIRSEVDAFLNEMAETTILIEKIRG